MLLFYLAIFASLSLAHSVLLLVWLRGTMPVWRLALVTGFLGALTTFSSFSAEVVGMLMQERYGLAGLTALLHLAGSLVLTVIGIRSAMFFIARYAI